ncbi:MAG: ATP-binding protein [Myxococcota bacterium]
MAEERGSKPRISRFEWQILAALFLTGLAPFAISLYYIPQITEERAALSLHSRVRNELESSTLLYKEFFDAKKQAMGARIEALARDQVLVRAEQEGPVADVESRLSQILDDNRDLRSLAVSKDDGELIARVEGPADRQGDEFTPKSFRHPLGTGSGAVLEVVFLLPQRYVEAQEQAADIAYLYDAALKASQTIQREQTTEYALRVSFVLLLALFAGYALARRVTKRVARLAQATERVAKGDLEFVIEPAGRDEITELTEAFNTMITEVKGARERIVFLEKVSGWQEFARRLAHEIKNPLTPIQLAIQELRRRTPEDRPEFKKFVDDAADMVEEEIASLTRLVDEFSQFARLPEVVPEEVELKAYLEEFLAAYNRFEPEATVDLKMPAEPVQASIDRVLMRRVLANLATNAIQAAGAGKAQLTIALSSTEQAAELRIEDNGPGVPDDMAGKIFEPYFTTKAEGTGLGLAIVKKIVLQHGGTIALGRSAAGGASFTIVLPRARG